MFCLGIDRKIQLISADSEWRIKIYKISDIVLCLLENEIHWEICYNDGRNRLGDF